jgi:cyclic pyranopterin phosphate synthase
MVSSKVQPLLPRQRLLQDSRGRPLRDLRLSVIDRCNFRCPYCMPRERFHDQYRFLKSSERLDFSELLRLTRLFLQLGVVKLRITGGEPLLRAGLADLIGDLTSLPGIEDVALTTNGVLLAQHAAALRAAGLQRVTVSLDSLDPAVFAQMAGGFGSVDDVLAGIAAAQRAGLAPIKLNAVIQRGVNDHQVLALVGTFAAPASSCASSSTWTSATATTGIASAWCRRSSCSSSSRALAADRARPGVSRRSGAPLCFRRRRRRDRVHLLGHQPFCGDCSRARLSSDGKFYTCLFAAEGTDLRAPLRGGASDEELLQLIRAVWERRADRYSELRDNLRARGVQHVEMNYVGG